MSTKDLIITGARQNNLKNINLQLPHNKVIAITGVSGSGKSSLAFDTIFAEGQWRFIESLSSYARLFLEKLDRPDVDEIRNIRPAIALEQHNPIRGSRSTVGSLTELYELFRLFYSKIAIPYCPRCGKEMRRWDPSQIISELTEKYPGEKALIIFETNEDVQELKKRGFHRFWIDDEIKEAEDVLAEKKRKSKRKVDPLGIVLDRLIIRSEPRLSDSIELAWEEGRGAIKIFLVSRDSTSSKTSKRVYTPLTFSSGNSCDDCAIELPLASPLLFSFNHPVGACPECKGFGNTLQYDEDLIIPDKNRSLADGAIDPWNKPAYKWWKRQMLKQAKQCGIDISKPYGRLGKRQRSRIFKGTEECYGIHDFFEYLEGKKYKLHVRVFLSRYRKAVLCPACNGKRINKEALSYKISGLDIAELCSMSLSDISAFFSDIALSPFSRDMVKELFQQITMKLAFLEKVRLDYLTLDRYSKTLSGGEFQRISLSNQLASLLTGTLYVLDEPTVGLHPRDTDVIAEIMQQLADLGNTVIVVEHDRGIIESADWIVELGPGGGQQGGKITFSGEESLFLKTDTLTAKYIRGIETVDVSHQKRALSGSSLSAYNASGHNLKGVDLHIPLRSLTVLTGVSGSGKSSLAVETLYRSLTKRFKKSTERPLPHDKIEGHEQLENVALIDQSPIGRSPRSNPVTYLKIFDHIRKLFAEQREARAYGYGPGFFSFNVTGGRCETCKGEGYELMEMYFFEDLYITCEKCGGKRYKPEALRITYREKNIHDILHMTVEEACILFQDHPAVRSRLDLLMDTGLGYLRLGQPATTLSGGEAQRLKICSELSVSSKENYLYILDEPTVGLHFRDISALLIVLNRLVDSGNTVLVIEHNLDVIKSADWIVDLGPEGGEKGGKIIFAGPPADIIHSKDSYTGRYLNDYLSRALKNRKPLQYSV
jgi:excinuclease ABC subunit A